MGEALHIAFCTDEKYAKYTGVAIISIILNNIGENLCFHIVYDDINATEKEKFLLLEKLYVNVQVKLYEFQDIEKVVSYKTGYHFTKAMYYRIFLPHIVDENIQKILYLDGDTLCLGNIAMLFGMDMNEFSLMAFCNYSEEDKIRLQLESSKVFNSGQLLIDTARWRRENTTAKLLQILNERHTEFTWGG